MVNYIFSDKTGTLTQNIMEFKKFSAGFQSYGGTPIDNSQTAESVIEYAKGVTNVNFFDAEFDRQWKNPESENYGNLKDFIEILGVCHTSKIHILATSKSIWVRV